MSKKSKAHKMQFQQLAKSIHSAKLDKHMMFYEDVTKEKLKAKKYRKLKEFMMELVVGDALIVEKQANRYMTLKGIFKLIWKGFCILSTSVEK